MPRLCVNIDHVATLRQVRGERLPDPVGAAVLVEEAGAHGVTVHLREDRRHIQDRDVYALRKVLRTKLNLEMAATPEMERIALKVGPDQVTLVPEKRRELTTEGGLSLKVSAGKFERMIGRLQRAGIPVSLFIDPDPEAILLSARLGASFIEIHTGAYSRACLRKGPAGRPGKGPKERALGPIVYGAKLAQEMGLGVNAGHGLTYENVLPIASLEGIEDLNIGHNIVARSLVVGLKQAVGEMLALLRRTGR